MPLSLCIEHDQDAQSPREWDNLGKMVCFHRRYNLGDKHTFSVEEAKALAVRVEKEGGVVLPLYLYDHSGITIATTPFSCPWDSGRVGFIYADRAAILKMFGKTRMAKGMKDAAKDQLQKEVKTYDQYLTGEVYGYMVKDEKGEELDSCWGFFGEDAAKEQGQDSLKYLQAQADKEKMRTA